MNILTDLEELKSIRKINSSICSVLLERFPQNGHQKLMCWSGFPILFQVSACFGEGGRLKPLDNLKVGTF